MSYITLSNDLLVAFAVTGVLVLAILMVVKNQLQNTSSEQNLMDELAKKDNFCYGRKLCGLNF